MKGETFPPSVARLSVHPEGSGGRPVALRLHLSVGLPLSGCVFGHKCNYGNARHAMSFFYIFLSNVDEWILKRGLRVLESDIEGIAADGEHRFFFWRFKTG